MRVTLGGCEFAVSSLTWAEPDKGHDRLSVHDGFVGVADGATPLTPGGQDPGDFAARALSGLRLAGTDGDATGVQVWRRAIASTASQGAAATPGVSCSVATVRERGARLEFGRLGDCSVLVTLLDGGLLRMQDATIAALDRRAKRSLFTSRRLLRNRARMNTDKGYWIFADATRAADFVQFEIVEAARVGAFALFSDGLRTGTDSDELGLDDLTVVLGERCDG